MERPQPKEFARELNRVLPPFRAGKYLPAILLDFANDHARTINGPPLRGLRRYLRNPERGVKEARLFA